MRRATATHARPHESDAAGASLPFPPTAISTPTAPAMRSTTTAQTSAPIPNPSKLEAISRAVTFAAVAIATQPRYRPTVPSATIVSKRFFGLDRSVRRKAHTSTANSAAINGTLRTSRSNWMLRIHAALRMSDAAIGYPSRRWRASDLCAGRACHTAYARRPR